MFLPRIYKQIQSQISNASSILSDTILGKNFYMIAQIKCGNDIVEHIRGFATSYEFGAHSVEPIWKIEEYRKSISTNKEL